MLGCHVTVTVFQHLGCYQWCMFRFRCFLVFLSLLLAFSASAQLQVGSPWPKYLQNNLNTGLGAGSGSNGLEKWTFATGLFIASSPAIAKDGTIYVGSYDNSLYAINADGTKKWSFPTQNSIWSSPAIGADGTIYVGSLDGQLYAINPDGTQKWIFATRGEIYSSPAIDANGVIYFGSYDQYVYAVNPDGSQRWEFLSPEPV